MEIFFFQLNFAEYFSTSVLRRIEDFTLTEENEDIKSSVTASDVINLAEVALKLRQERNL